MCLSGIKNQTRTSNLSAAKLVNIKSYGYLTHPDHSFFILLKQIEKSFLKHCNSQNVFEDTIEDFFNDNHIIPFPCNVHKGEMVQYIFTSYITMRMRQHTYLSNQQNKGSNRLKKKLSKLVTK
uniref:Uncharacterized protein n=1 Tax=Schizaphis graminum TaxID=13262 RepID=A0A2S2NM34_SCHGA